MKNEQPLIRTNQASTLSLRNRLGRALWQIVWVLLFRLSPVPFHGWRRGLLRLFGARIGRRAKVYPSVSIWAPWNLTMKEGAVLAPHVICYSVARISIGRETTVSQYSHLCAATHDFEDPAFPLVKKPIRIENQVWIAADVFIGPGVTIGEGTVVGARSSVFTNLPPWEICLGTPARPVRERKIKQPKS